VLFEMPGPVEREPIWRVQLHPTRTPLAADVDFRALAVRYEVSGGDIRNAVLKAALTAAARPGPDSAKRIHQNDLVAGIESVLAGKQVMRQSVFADNAIDAAGQGFIGEATAQHMSRLLAYAVGLAGLAFIVAVIALVIATIK
jgi:hypothetical protein